MRLVKKSAGTSQIDFILHRTKTLRLLVSNYLVVRLVEFEI